MVDGEAGPGGPERQQLATRMGGDRRDERRTLIRIGTGEHGDGAPVTSGTVRLPAEPAEGVGKGPHVVSERRHDRFVQTPGCVVVIAHRPAECRKVPARERRCGVHRGDPEVVEGGPMAACLQLGDDVAVHFRRGMRLAEVDRQEPTVEQRDWIFNENVGRLDRRVADVVAPNAPERRGELVLHPGLETERRLDAVGSRRERHLIAGTVIESPHGADHGDADRSRSAKPAAGRNKAPEADLDRSSRRGSSRGHGQERVLGSQRVAQIDDRIESEFVDDDPRVVRRQVDRPDGHLDAGLDGNVGDGSPDGEPRVGPTADVRGPDRSAHGDRPGHLAQRLRGRSEMGSRGDTAVQSYRRVRSSEPPGGRRYPVPVRFRPSRRALVALALACVTASVVAVPVYAQKLPKNLGEYIAEADKLCAASNVKLLAESRKIETESARSTRGGRLKKVDIALPYAVSKFALAVAVPELEKLSASLRDIPSPRDEEKTIDTLLDQFDAGIAAVKKDPKSAIFSDQLKASSKAFKAMRFGENTKFSACGIHIDRDEDKKK